MDTQANPPQELKSNSFISSKLLLQEITLITNNMTAEHSLADHPNEFSALPPLSADGRIPSQNFLRILFSIIAFLCVLSSIGAYIIVSQLFGFDTFLEKSARQEVIKNVLGNILQGKQNDNTVDISSVSQLQEVFNEQNQTNTRDRNISGIYAELPYVDIPAPPLSNIGNANIKLSPNYGILPIRNANGVEPWRAYKYNFNNNKNLPIIAIIINNLGITADATAAAIYKLPGAITLAFSIYTKQLIPQIKEARNNGHEVLLSIPFEQYNPFEDIANYGLSSQDTLNATEDKILSNLGRALGYVGVIAYKGSAFTTSYQHMSLILNTLHQSGLIYVHNYPNADPQALPLTRSPIIEVNYKIESEKGSHPENLEFINAFAQLELIAKQTGYATMSIESSPMAFRELQKWEKTLAHKNILLAPISAVQIYKEERLKQRFIPQETLHIPNNNEPSP